MQAYYSAKMAELTGTVIYEGEDGRDVECTEVCKGASSAKWDDLEPRGPVKRYLRKGSAATKPLHRFA